MLLWCSPLFNRSDDQTRWNEAYTTMKADLERINKCGYGLYQGTKNVNASSFAEIFTQSKKNPEAVFLTLYNNKAGDGLDDQKNNRWERDIRPSNTGGGGLRASQMLIDEFPMADGKIPASSASAYSKLEVSAESYDNTLPLWIAILDSIVLLHSLVSVGPIMVTMPKRIVRVLLVLATFCGTMYGIPAK